MYSTITSASSPTGAESPNEIDAAPGNRSSAPSRINKPFEGIDVARALNAMKRAQARLGATKGK
jgi:hypothetical protein